MDLTRFCYVVILNSYRNSLIPRAIGSDFVCRELVDNIVVGFLLSNKINRMYAMRTDFT